MPQVYKVLVMHNSVYTTWMLLAVWGKNLLRGVCLRSSYKFVQRLYNMCVCVCVCVCLCVVGTMSLIYNYN
jgi:hypothetical protein